MSDSLWPHEPRHAKPPCPSPTPRVHPNPCPLSLFIYIVNKEKSLETQRNHPRDWCCGVSKLASPQPTSFQISCVWFITKSRLKERKKNLPLGSTSSPVWRKGSIKEFSSLPLQATQLPLALCFSFPSSTAWRCWHVKYPSYWQTTRLQLLPTQSQSLVHTHTHTHTQSTVKQNKNVPYRKEKSHLYLEPMSQTPSRLRKVKDKDEETWQQFSFGF